MIELFTSDTPNGKKITILLEEISCDFKVTAMDLSKDDQFKTDFKKISPFSKIPVIVDHENKESVFESGAILIYLAEKYDKFYEKKDRNLINLHQELCLFLTLKCLYVQTLIYLFLILFEIIL